MSDPSSVLQLLWIGSTHNKMSDEDTPSNTPPPDQTRPFKLTTYRSDGYLSLQPDPITSHFDEGACKKLVDLIQSPSLEIVIAGHSECTFREEIVAAPDKAEDSHSHDHSKHYHNAMVYRPVEAVVLEEVGNVVTTKEVQDAWQNGSKLYVQGWKDDNLVRAEDVAPTPPEVIVRRSNPNSSSG